MFIALEPRIMLDAAGVALLADVLAETVADANHADASTDAAAKTCVTFRDTVSTDPSHPADTAIAEKAMLETAVDPGPADKTAAEPKAVEKVPEVKAVDTTLAVADTAVTRREIAVVDASVPDADSLIAGLPSNIEVIRIDGNSSGLSQLDAVLAGQQDIDALHIFSHGSAGSFTLGTDLVDKASLDQYASRLSSIGHSLNAEGDILLYGCNIGQDGGFVDRISELTGADVAASNDATGATALGGDWVLEAETGGVGAVDAAPLHVVDYTHLLTTVNLGAVDLATTFGSTYYVDYYYYTMTLSNPSGMAPGGSVWGNGIYTDDSRIGQALWFEAGTYTSASVTIQILPDPGSYSSSTSNGITTSSYGAWSSGAYDIISYSTTTNYAPSVTSGSTASVSENVSTSTTVYTATGSDPESQALTYSLGGTDGSLFNINSSTGAVTFKSSPNYESPSDSGANNVYDITVTATDTGSLSASKAVAITVTNVNEAPTVTAPASFSVTEDVSGNLTYTGTPFADADSSSLTATLSISDGTITGNAGTGVTVGGTATSRTFSGSVSDLNTYFKTSGKITWQSALNSTSSRTLTTTVSDGSQSTSANSTISVSAVNDAPVRTAGSLSAITVNEDSANSTAATLNLGSVTYGNGGGSDENTQSLTYTMTSIPSFITLWKSTGTQVAAGGTVSANELQGLQYKTIANANGIGAIQWTVVDNGGTANGGVNTLTESLSVTVNAAPAININQSLSFDGTNDYISISNIAFPSGPAFTEEVWIKPSDATFTFRGILGYESGSPNQRTPGIWQYGKKVHYGFGNGSAWISGTTASDVLTIGEWNHVAVTYDGSTLTLYVNGVVADSLATTASPYQNSTLYIGRVDNYFYGQVADVRIWSDARTQPEIQGNMHSALQGNETGLLAYYPFNDADGTSVDDSSTNSYTGTATNFASMNRSDDGPPLFKVVEDVAGSLIFSGTPFADIDGDPLTVTLSANDGLIAGQAGTGVSIGGTDTSRTFSGSAANLNTYFGTAGNITYTTAQNQTGSRVLTISAFDGAATTSTTETITVTAVNDAPTSTNDSVTVQEDTATLLAAGDFGSYSDVEGSSMASVKITALESAGDLEYNNSGTWTDVTLSQVVTVADIAAGKLRYAAAQNANGNGYATIGFAVSDGTDWSIGTYTLTLDVSAVNDAPVASGSASLSVVNEGAVSPAGATVSSLFGGNFQDTADGVTGGSSANTLAGVAVTGYTADAAKGAWQYSTDGGSTWTSIGAVSDTSALKLQATSKLRFLPVAYWSGTAPSLTARLIDSSTTVTNATGVNVSVNGGATAISSGTVSLGASVTAVNDAPVLYGNSLDGALSFDGSNDYVSFADNDSSISTAFTLEAWINWTGSGTQFIGGKAVGQMELQTSGSSLRFNPTDHVWIDAYNVLTANQWTYVAAEYDAANSIARVYVNGQEVPVVNNGTNPIGTALLSSDTSFFLGKRSDNSYYFQGSIGEFRIWNDIRTAAEIQAYWNQSLNGSEPGLVNLWRMNDASGTAVADSVLVAGQTPNNGTISGATWVPASTHSMASITEDATSNSGSLVSTILDTSVSDPDSSALEGMAITSLASGRGTWQYSTDNGSNWGNVGTVSDTSALLLRATDKVRFVPDAINSDSASLTYKAWDQTSGTQGNKADTSSSGGSTAFSAASDTVQITVSAVNDAPVVSLISNPYAIHLDGTNDYLSTGSSLLNNLTAYTVSFWLNPDRLTAGLRQDLVGQNDAFEIFLTGTTLTFWNTGTPQQNLTFDLSSVLSVGGWTHIAITGEVSTSTVKVYANGNLLGSQTHNSITNYGTSSYTLTAGGYVSDASFAHNFQGYFDEISIWNTAKSGSEIAALQTSKLGGSESGLLGYWALDEGSGTSAGNGVSGAAAATAFTLVNGAAWSASTLGGQAAYTEQAAAVSLRPWIVLSDVDNATLSSATVSVSSGLTTGDTLSFTNDGSSMGNVAATYNSANGQLSLSSSGATATIAQWTAALKSVSFYSSADVPGTSRTITWSVNDGSLSSSGVSSTIQVTPVDDAPVVSTATSSGMYSLADIGTAYVDMVTDGGGWVLVGYGSSGALGGYLTAASGTYDAARQGAATLDALAYMQGSNEMAISWTSNGAAKPNGDIGSYAYAVAFTLPNPSSMSLTAGVSPAAGNTASDFSLTGTSSSESLVTLRSLQGNPGLPSQMYIRNTTFGVNYGNSYGLVTNTGFNNQLDWNPDTQNFQALYVDHSGAGATTGYVTTGGTSNGYVPSTMAIWVRRAQPATGYAENASAKALAPVLSLSDVDNTALASATVSISSGFTADDTLSFTNAGSSLMGNIAASYNQSSGTLTLTSSGATATLGQWEAALAAVKYSSSSENPTATSSSRTLGWTINDGVANSSTVSTTLSVTAVNDVPTLTGLTNKTVAENATASVLDSAVVFEDVDSADLNGGTLTVSGLDSEDVVSIATGVASSSGAIQRSGDNVQLSNGSTWATIGTVSGGSGTDFVVSFSSASATPTVVDAVIQSLTFYNNDDTPTASRTLSFVVNDGDGGTSTTQSMMVAVTAANDVPTLGGFAAAIDSVNEDTQVELTLAELKAQGDEADVDGTVEAFVVKAVSSGTLKIGASSATASAWESGTNDTVDATHNAYWTSAQDANGTLNALTVVAKDNSGAESMTARQATVSVTSVNDAPVMTAGATATYLENASAATGGGSSLSFGGGSYVSIPSNSSFPAGNSNYTIEAWIKPTNLGDYGIIGWGNWSGNQANALRLQGNSNELYIKNYWWDRDLYARVTGVNLLDGYWHHVAATYNGTTRSIYLDGTLIGSDEITSHNVPANPGNIRIGSTNNGEYFPGGIDEVRVWSVARTALQLSGAKDAPISGSTTGLVAYYRFDEGSGSTTANLASTGSSLDGTLMNSPTWLSSSAVGADTITPVLTLTDVDDTSIASGATVTISSGLTTGDTLSIDSSSLALGITASYDATTGVLTFTGSASVSAYQSMLRGVKYASSSDDPTAGGTSTTRTVTYSVTDANAGGSGGGVLTATATSTITVTAVNDAPTLSGLTAKTVSENASASLLDSDVTFGDVDSADLNGGSLTVSGLDSQDVVSIGANTEAAPGAIRLNGSNVQVSDGSTWTTIGTASGGSGTNFVVSFSSASATPTLVDALIQSLTFYNNDESPTASRTLSLVVSDGDGGTSSTQSMTVSITAANDAPAFTQGDSVASSPSQSTMALTVQQYTGFQSNVLNTLRTYASTHTANYTVTAEVIDYTDDPSGFAGLIPGSYRWPAAVATNYYGTDGINNNFFARITGSFYVNTQDNYTFRTYNDDGVFLIIDGNYGSPVISDNGYHGEQQYTGTVNLAVGTHTVELFFFENGGEASLEFAVKSSTSDYGHIGSTNPLFTKPATYDTGVIGFGDLDGTADDGDHTVSVIPGSDVLGTLTASVTTATSSGGGGQITWSYSAAESAVRYLDANQTKMESFTIKLADNNGGFVDKVVNITLTGTNDAPTSTADSVTVNEDASVVLAISDFGTFADVDGDSIASVKISSLESAGDLEYKNSGVWTDVTSDQVIMASDIAAGYLRYSAAQNANKSGYATIGFMVNDGTAFSAMAYTLTVNVSAVNDAPVASGSATLSSVAEDASSLSGATVSSLFGGNFSDATDSVTGGSSANTLAGVAITGYTADADKGSWQYTTNGSTWNNIGTVSDTSAVTLGVGANDKLRFLPASNWNGTAPSLTARLIESSTTVTSGSIGVDVSANGNATAISSGTVVLGTSVTAVNDAPVASGSTSVTVVNEDAAAPTGATVSSLFGGNFNDATDSVTGGSSANTLAGVAITGYTADADKGSWQYTTNGSTWNNIGTVSDTSAVTLGVGANDRLRFVPAANWNGTAPSLTARLIESSTTVTSGSAGVDVSANGNATAISSGTVVLGTSVTAVNDAPVASGSTSLTAVNEDTASPTGSTVSSLFGGNFSDTSDAVSGGSSANMLAGVAITGYTADADKGSWQYTTNGSTWNNIGTVSDTSAVTLGVGANDRLRFVPAANWNGTAPSLTARLIESSTTVTSGSAGVDVSANGNATAISSGTVVLGTSVTAVNDAPVASGSTSVTVVNEDAAAPTGATVSSLFGGNFNDATDSVTGGSSANTLAGVAITGYTADADKGSWQYTTNGSTWNNIGTVSDTSAVTLGVGANDRLRFVPAANWNGTAPSLTARLIESSTTVTSGSAGVDVSANGNATAISSGTVVLGTSVTAVNDAPVASGSTSVTAVNEDTASPTGETVSNLFGGNFNDATDAVSGGSSANTLAGVAITGYTADADKGAWQYSFDGGSNWTAISSSISSASSALSLKSTDYLRFRPASNWNGSAPTLTVTLIDSTVTVTTGASINVSNGGGTTAYSSSSVVLSHSVTAVNDAPVFSDAAAVSSDASLISQYAFNGSISDAIGGDTVTVFGTTGDPSNKTSSFGSDATGNYWSWTTENRRGGGFIIDADLANNSAYTVALRFSFSDVSGYRKIIDYLDRASDTGFYLLSGKVNFYPLGTGSTVYSSNQVIDLIATRDAATNKFTVYLSDGSGGYSQGLEVTDTGGTSKPAMVNGKARFGFFFDDNATSGEATSAGKVYEIKIWNRALAAGEISTALVANKALTEGNAALSTSGTLPLADADAGDTLSAIVNSVSVSGPQGSLGNADILGMMSVTGSSTASGTGTSGTAGWRFDSGSQTFDYLRSGETLTMEYTIRASDAAGLTADKQVTITVAGTNDAPVVTNTAGSRVGSVAEAGHLDDGTAVGGTSPAITGTLSSSDVDALATNSWSLAGVKPTTYGTMSIDASTGVWTYTLDNSLVATQALKEGEEVTQVYTARVTDDKGAYADQTLTVTINGTNDVPVVTNAATALAGSVTEAGHLDDGTSVAGTPAASGTLSSSDVDASATKSWSLAGSQPTTYGTMSINASTGVWTYTLDNSLVATQALKEGEEVTQSYTARATDEFGAYVDQKLTVTIDGTNDVPVVTNAVTSLFGSVVEAGHLDDGTPEAGTPTATGTLSSSDVDASATKNWSIEGTASETYGTIAINASTGLWT
ncbi:MAG: DUF4347 domain-containing protein, partial [Chlorobiaceae bacterium]|nr:DUF4347 domain-containing protein [Chlorobiaceae bacterium]